MSIKFHLEAKERAQHDATLKPESTIEVEISRSTTAGAGHAGGSFELQLFRRNEVSSEWEMVGTSTVGIGAQARTVFDALDRGRDYAIGVFYEPSPDGSDSALHVDGNIIVH